MSSQSAKSLSMALVGGVLAMVFFWQGLLVWAGFVGWAAYSNLAPEPKAFSKAIAGMILGAVLAWVALMVNARIPVPANGWLWIPRIGLTVAVTLFILVMASRNQMFSRISTLLLGYAAVFGATAEIVAGQTGDTMLQSLHQANPLINSVLSLVLGGVFALGSDKLAGSLSKA